jgi:aryl-phospho-beta-D-glucosidase BglC (GH1 family)
MPVIRLLLSLLLTSLALQDFTPARAQSPDPGWPSATAEKLPRWRGFNLLNKFMVSGNTPFDEADFRMIHDLGFNFVRIPMDYRIWIVNGDWTKIDERAAFHDLDQAVAWGDKYHVHICLNFHRAPGYTVASPPETRSLWTDPEAQRVCILHWAAFARHFKGIPSERLSFDLFNEPTGIDGKTYAAVVAKVAGAIRAEDPDRLIICDGLDYGNVPVPELIPLHVAQSTHDYVPIEVTHYHASWMPGSDKFPVPTWPLLRGASGYLYGPWKADLKSTLVLTGNFAAGTRLEFTVGTVSTRSRLVIRADDQVLLDKSYVCGPDAKEGERVVFLKEYSSYQNIYNQVRSITLAKAAGRITLSNEDGDWLTMTALALRAQPSGPAYTLPLDADWGEKQITFAFDPSRPGQPWTGGPVRDRAWIWDHQLAPWKSFEAQGVGVMVGEFGCYNQTPDDVAMRWMEDTLANFQRAGWGWALWNFKGEFGVLDSGRRDVKYEDYQGHKLDRRMLELLQKY